MNKESNWEISKHARCPKCDSYLAYIPADNEIDVKYFCPNCDYVETNGCPKEEREWEPMNKADVLQEEIEADNPGGIWFFIFIALVYVFYKLVWG